MLFIMVTGLEQHKICICHPCQGCGCCWSLQYLDGSYAAGIVQPGTNVACLLWCQRKVKTNKPWLWMENTANRLLWLDGDTWIEIYLKCKSDTITTTVQYITAAPNHIFRNNKYQCRNLMQNVSECLHSVLLFCCRWSVSVQHLLWNIYCLHIDHCWSTRWSVL